jgi:hypothetical protein
MKIIIIILSLACFRQFAHAAVVTLTAQANSGTNGVAELSVGQYEVAELISFPKLLNGVDALLYLEKDGKTFVHSYDWRVNFVDPLIVAGPANFRLVAQASGSGRALCTFKITPEAYPPDRAILIPPGTNQARITLECSTNLVQWFAATNGVYGPLPEAKFFRIKLDAPN